MAENAEENDPDVSDTLSVKEVKDHFKKAINKFASFNGEGLPQGGKPGQILTMGKNGPKWKQCLCMDEPGTGTGTVFTISFNTDGGTPDYGNIEVEEGDDFELPAAPLKDGYVFNEWAHDGELYPAGSTLTPGEDMHFVAMWRVKDNKLGLQVDTRISRTLTLYGLSKRSCSDDIIIDCGNGTTWTYNSLPASGNTVFEYNTAGIVDISIEAETADIAFSKGNKANENLLAISGSLPAQHNLIDASRLFAYCSNLKAVSAEAFHRNEQFTNFQSCFYDCTSLASIPENLFAMNKDAHSFNGALKTAARLKLYREGFSGKIPVLLNLSAAFVTVH